ncbi:hypothetical protein BCR42DRAFT_204488 [Absidia repens]|uniref:Uncharacterized protein n=1 Tax=Absidia repens TaxID=90262 RepID=A0A1X2IPP3_9FUNG|nr:hypothetical protein BCR42DRAFT_204488 [Absidia repens]
MCDLFYRSSTLCGMNNAQYRLQQSLPQQQQLVKPTSSSLSHNMDCPPILSSSPSTLRKYGKDDHYFRSGHVEQTKQKLLGDEQSELEKQCDKDIALLAQTITSEKQPFCQETRTRPSANLFSLSKNRFTCRIVYRNRIVCKIVYRNRIVCRIV